MWKQELVWVKRNAQGVAVGFSSKSPKTEDFIPTVQTKKAATAMATSR